MTASGSTVAAFVRDLELVAHGDVARDGAKGATLGGLLSAGLPVPGGFVIETAAYREFVSATELRRCVADCLDGLDVDDPAACRQAAADIHVGMVATPLPAAISDAITDAYAGLSDAGPCATVAVRSSTSTPDTGSHMLAHLNDTFLCVRGTKAVLDAVRRCWASLYSERALLLRDKLGFADVELDIAVVVQHQVLATRAGVLLTGPADRGTERRMVIEASYGLGEGPATGAAHTDRYLIDEESLDVLAREINRKDVVVDEAVGDGGTRRRAVVGEQVSNPALLDAEIRMLAKLGVLVEDRLRAPQVVEWAIDRTGKAWILQSTPLSVGSMSSHR